MPTASTESAEKKGPVEVQTPIKQAIAIVEKKVRNLEKRKNKLDLIKQKAASGHQLEADQRNAIEHYNEVIQTLEYSRQLQKQFAAIQTEASKMLKKQARRDKLDRQIHEMKRIEELLKVQNLLDNMGSQTVRADFQTGKHGAVVLTEENLNQLDELYQLISPTREGDGEYHKKVNTAAEHIVCLLEGKQKEVIGTTYKDLKELVDLISGCGYFETVKTIENEKKSTEISEVADDDQFEGSADVASSEDDKTESQHDETPLDIPPMTQAPQEHREQQVAPPPTRMSGVPTTQPDSNTYYANANEIYPTPCQRPIDEIVSSVQGSFNFLQESTIDVDSAPHNDPAVVAAQPMSRQSSQQQQQQQQDTESTRPISGFGSQVYDRQTDPSPPAQHPSLGHGDQRYPQQPEQGLAYTTTSSSSSQQQQQPFRQGLPSKSWASQVEDHELMPDAAIGQFESIPPSIPLPQTQDNQQSNNSNQSEKKFTMNAAAPAFQSMYTQRSADQADDESGHATQNTDSTSANFQNNRYQNDGFQQRGSRREGGGFRGRGARGGVGNSGGSSSNNGSGGMQNGFNRNSGTGGGQNTGRGGRGSYQGYAPRNNFQGDGYQGYSGGGGGGGSGGFGQNYKQRGAGGGTNPGQARGGSGGGARGTGGIRGGGVQRGGNNAPRGGAPRGGSGNSSGSGFSRQGAAQFQQ